MSGTSTIVGEAMTVEPDSSAPAILVAGKPKKKTKGDALTLRGAGGKFRSVGGLESSVGGREQLVEILEQGSKTAQLEILVTMLADPARAKLSMASICEDAGISAKDLMHVFRDGAIAKAVNDAHVHLARKLTTVVSDVADKAHNHLEPCRCTVGNTVSSLPECPECRGTGQVYYRGSLPHQQMVFESTGILKRGGGVNVNVQQQVAVGSAGLFDRFVKATDAAAYGQKVVDVEAQRVEED
jgi:hypothetical protein